MCILTREQSRQLDQLAIERLGIPGIVLMENAGINATSAIIDLLDDGFEVTPAQSQVAVLCGGGNNGGDGYVIARHLHNWGAQVTLYAARDPDTLRGDAAINHRICAQMGLPIRLIHDDQQLAQQEPGWYGAHVIVDALLGTGFTGQVRQPLRRIIELCNAARQRVAHVVAIDTPSGLDVDTGQPGGVCVHADLTVTFAAMKLGFTVPGAEAYTGRIVVADIGIPPSLIASLAQ